MYKSYFHIVPSHVPNKYLKLDSYKVKLTLSGILHFQDYLKMLNWYLLHERKGERVDKSKTKGEIYEFTNFLLKLYIVIS